jgi:hypothetical protein
MQYRAILVVIAGGGFGIFKLKSHLLLGQAYLLPSTS